MVTTSATSATVSTVPAPISACSPSAFAIAAIDVTGCGLFSGTSIDVIPAFTNASATGTAGAVVNKAEASLPPEIRQRLERTRRAGDADAAVDPMSTPEVRAALARATFELLIGFQLTEDQLAYNATR